MIGYFGAGFRWSEKVYIMCLYQGHNIIIIIKFIKFIKVIKFIIKKEVSSFDERFGWTNDTPEQVCLHMSEELGEISRLLLQRSKYKKGEAIISDFEDEMADLTYLTIKLSNLLDADLSAGWKRIGERYDKK